MIKLHLSISCPLGYFLLPHLSPCVSGFSTHSSQFPPGSHCPFYFKFIIAHPPIYDNSWPRALCSSEISTVRAPRRLTQFLWISRIVLSPRRARLTTHLNVLLPLYYFPSLRIRFLYFGAIIIRSDPDPGASYPRHRKSRFSAASTKLFLSLQIFLLFSLSPFIIIIQI